MILRPHFLLFHVLSSAIAFSTSPYFHYRDLSPLTHHPNDEIGHPHEASNSTEIYEQLRIQSEQNCLIPHPHDENENYDQDDPRTILDKSKHCLIFYLHIHKSGGTTICSTIRHQGFVSNPKPIENCLPPRRYHNHEFTYSMEHNYNFIAQEGPYFRPNLTNTQILYMTTIRHPYDRIISHLHHEFCNRKEAEAIEVAKRFECDFDIRKATLSEIILSNCFNGTMQQLTSNFYLRMFTNCITKECTEEHLKEAIEKLNLMSVVMITDTPELYAKYSQYPLHVLSPFHALSSSLPSVDTPTFCLSSSPSSTNQSTAAEQNKTLPHSY
jgi:hypothetical protein